MSGKIINRYAAAVHSSNLKSDPSTVYSDTDVLGAVGYGGKPPGLRDDGSARRSSPLAMALLRMFTGGDREGKQIVTMMVRMLQVEAHKRRDSIGPAGASIIARAVLDWHRDSTCRTCRGHGYQTIGGALGQSRTVVSDQPCDACHGAGKRPFDALFPPSRLDLAHWLRSRVEEKTNLAGTVAMAALAPRLKIRKC